MRERHRLSKFLLRSGQRSTHWGEGHGRALIRLWVAAATLHTDRSGGHAARIICARSSTCGNRWRASGASHHGGREAGLARVTASHQRSCRRCAVTARYLGCDHYGRAGPSIPLKRQCSAADGVLRRGAQRETPVASESDAESITKTGSNAHMRRIVGEAAWSLSPSTQVIWAYGLRRRQESISEEVKEIAWKAQHRLHKRYMKLGAAEQAPGKDHYCSCSRELLGFIWAIGTRAEDDRQPASCSLTGTKLSNKEKSKDSSSMKRATQLRAQSQQQAGQARRRTLAWPMRRRR